VVGYQGTVLLLHGSSPIGIGKGSTVALRDR
jgi:hypothetical protein